MRDPTPLYLVIDQGGHASRAFLFDSRGHELSRGTTPITAEVTATDYAEYDAEALVSSIRAAIHAAVNAPGITLSNIVAAGLATQRANVACWDRLTGNALSPLISWQDRRAAEWITQFSADAEQLHQQTGLFLSPHYGVGKLHWCYQNLPAVREAHRRHQLCWGPMSSYLLFQLLDERPYLVDHINASRTLLWNINRCEWEPTLLKLFGLAENPLPRTVPNCYRYGTLTIDGHAIPMTVVIGDQSASLFSWRQLQHDALYINIGTGAFIQRVTGGECMITPRQLTSLLLHQGITPTYALEGTVNGAGSAISWLEQQHPVDNLYQKIPVWLSCDDQPLRFLNGISGLGSPYWQPRFESHFIGDGDIAARYCAVIESIAFLLQVNIEQLQRRHSGEKKILISGGLARFDGLCQRIADLSDLTVIRMETDEATAGGLAWLLACHSGGNRNRWQEVEQQIFPPAENPPLRGRYRHWQHEMEAALHRRT